MLSVCEVEAIDEEIEVSEEVTASIICMKGKIENAMKANVSNQQHVGSPQATAQPVSQNVARTRLPKSSLPKFRGDVTKWNTFWDSFHSAVHRNEGISNIDKFNYLNSVLEGAAARAIQGLTLTEANYEAAVKLLQERFGRPQQIISAHMVSFLKCRRALMIARQALDTSTIKYVFIPAVWLRSVLPPISTVVS